MMQLANVQLMEVVERLKVYYIDVLYTHLTFCILQQKGKVEGKILEVKASAKLFILFPRKMFYDDY